MKLNLIKKVNHQSLSIVNVDGTEIAAVQHRQSKVRGNNAVASLTSAERGILITVITCMNANGTHVPSLMVFSRNNMKGELMDGEPAVSISA